MTLGESAKGCGVSEKTIADFEQQARTPYTQTLRELSMALEAAGVEFIPESGGGAGVRMRKANEA